MQYPELWGIYEDGQRVGPSWVEPHSLLEGGDTDSGRIIIRGSDAADIGIGYGWARVTTRVSPIWGGAGG